jgi:DNA-binding transcriptional MerR regulator
MEPKRWKVGELASATGLTVRTLHHYDEIGLLVPSERTESGHRLYSGADVTKLYRIAALRDLGLSLEDIGKWFEEGDDPEKLVRRHLEEVQRQLELNERLRDRLASILEALEREEEPDAEQFIRTVEVMSMHEKYYTPEQLEQLEKRRQEFGPEGMERAQKEWADLIAEVQAERAAGTAPTDPKMKPLVERWNGLIEAFTGGDPGIRESLQKMYETEGPQAASRNMVDPELMAYMGEAINAAS